MKLGRRRGRRSVEGERVLIEVGPSAWMVLTEGWMWWMAALAAGLVGGRMVWPLAALVVGLIWLAQGARWAARWHVLTNRRLIVRAGVVRRVVLDVPLDRIQQISIVRRGSERLVGIGTVIVETAGSGVGAAGVLGVAQPERIARILRRAMERARGTSRQDGNRGVQRPMVRAAEEGVTAKTKNSTGVLVLGIAGGIGAGKSAVAAAFAKLGCVVVDSDQESRAALDRPDVKGKLVEWWGGAVLGPDGKVDRRKVAEIVFKEPAQRTRLEGLVHPIVRQSRAQMVARASEGGVGVVIVDAPLLFEAGVDRECDAVVFVDAPEEVRLERVARTRGWTKSELERREAAQLALAEKRRRCRYVVVNDGAAAAMEKSVEAVLTQARRDFGVQG